MKNCTCPPFQIEPPDCQAVDQSDPKCPIHGRKSILRADRVHWVCPHGIDHYGDAYCRVCLRKAMSAQ